MVTLLFRIKKIYLSSDYVITPGENPDADSSTGRSLGAATDWLHPADNEDLRGTAGRLVQKIWRHLCVSNNLLYRHQHAMLHC